MKLGFQRAILEMPILQEYDKALLVGCMPPSSGTFGCLIEALFCCTVIGFLVEGTNLASWCNGGEM